MSLALILQGLYHLRINSPVVLLCIGLRWFAVMITTQRTSEIEPRLFIRVNVFRNFWGERTSTFRSHRKKRGKTIFNGSKINYSGILNDRCHQSQAY